jgi:hypothetical protein
MSERKTWWRNFQAPHRIQLRLAGVKHGASARAMHDGDEVVVIAELSPEGEATRQPILVTAAPAAPNQPRVDLYWLPLGAGDSSGCVRRNGRLFEVIAARRHHREPCDLYHSALEVHTDKARFTVEMTPAWGNADGERGVVRTGPVGLNLLGHSRFFRYEVRRWRDGTIPDRTEAVGGPQQVTDDVELARRLLALVPRVPAATWGRDELGTGDMWNSNSLTSWLLASSGAATTDLHPPLGGRAPGWDAGLVVAEEQKRETG